MGGAVDPGSRSDKGGKTKNQPKKKKKKEPTKEKTKNIHNRTSCPKGTRDEKQMNRKHPKTNQTPPSPNQTNQKPVASQILACSLLRHQIRTLSQERAASSRSDLTPLSPGCGPTPNLTPAGGEQRRN